MSTAQTALHAVVTAEKTLAHAAHEVADRAGHLGHVAVDAVRHEADAVVDAVLAPLTVDVADLSDLDLGDDEDQPA
jgi:hypothetical protein